jgi:hypothetical protein
MQWLGKHVYVARQQILNNEIVGVQQWKSCVLALTLTFDFELSSVESEFCTGVCEERT